MSYIDKLKDPRWQKKRLKVFERDEFRCQICWRDDLTLHIHHKYYKRGKEPWNYPIKALITLCSLCHEKIHPERYRKEPEYIATEEDLFKSEEDSEKAEVARVNFFEKYRKQK